MGPADHDSAGPSSPKTAGEDGNEDDKESQDETQGQQPLNVGTPATSMIHADAEKTLNHKVAKRPSSRPTS